MKVGRRADPAVTQKALGRVPAARPKGNGAIDGTQTPEEVET